MVNRIRLEEFRARFGITSDTEAFTRFRKRVVHAAETSLRAFLKDDRGLFEKEFAFRNGSEVIFGQNWGAGLDIRHGVIEELERAKTFIQLTERVQQLLWTFEAFGFFTDKQRYGDRDFIGLGFAGEFYESDCQGQFSSLLIAFSFSSLRSAPSDLKKINGSASGWAEQSCSAGSCQCSPSILVRRLQAIR